MRLHHLEIQAFGPFPEVVEIDFDELSAAGLFLLTGPTGAGKTSVLDAVCFALYGDVPGARGVAKRLRSDTASPDLPPRVRLEVTLAGRRFRFTRSPAWQRPKRRGSGLTPEQARVVCEERVGGSWQALSSRLDETGHLVQGLLGMTMTQFCQVALLPQGEFQGFLRARSDERHQLLQQLFATSQFEQVERWIRERARVTHRDSDARAQDLRNVLNRVEETLQELPGAPASPLEELEHIGAEHTDAIGAWLDDAHATSHTHLTTARQSLDHERRRNDSARAALQEARHLQQLRTRGSAARLELDELDSRRDARAADVARESAARDAAGLLPLHSVLQHQTAVAERLVQVLTQRLDQLHRSAHELRAPWWCDLGPVRSEPEAEPSSRLLKALAEAADGAAARVAALLPLVERRTEVEQELADLTEAKAAASAQRATLLRILESLPGDVERASQRLQDLRSQGQAHDHLRERHETISSARESLQRLAQRELVLDSAQATVATARERVLTAREAWLDLREARINGMAGELAGELASGCGCPVCGSTDHPAPAARPSGSVTAADEKSARQLLTDLEFALTSALEEERTVSAEVSGLRAVVAGRTEQQLDHDHAEVSAALSASVGALAEIPDAERELDARRAALSSRADEAAAIGEQLSNLGARHDALEAELQRVSCQVGAVVADYGIDDPVALHRVLDCVRDRANGALDAIRGVTSAHDAVTATSTEFEERLARSPFPSTQALLAAEIDAAQLAALRERIQADEACELVATATLADPEVSAALAAEPFDVALLEQEAKASDDALASAHGTAARAERRHERLDQLRVMVEGALGAWLPARRVAETTADLAQLLEGKSVDNRLRMRLSAYVLAWRLGQVVDAANERLARMTSGRYSLVHTDRRANRETRGGLSIGIRDDWSGEEREPATLSGGETFVVSLALALGLADVVTSESGGSSLDTLFVDEGFGSLDAETLDDVLDVLDTLREGGRVVGVVSHVAEMRSRIPTQLQVTKDQQGSRVRVGQRASPNDPF